MQNGDSSANIPAETPNTEKQSESAGEKVEIIHPDGRRETVQIAVSASWSGALPRPADFGRYGEIVPDAPERPLRMLEEEQQHRIAMERQLIPAEITAGTRGQIFGTAISIVALVLAAGTTAFGAPWQVSVALVGVPVLSVVRSLVAAIKKNGE